MTTSIRFLLFSLPFVVFGCATKKVNKVQATAHLEAVQGIDLSVMKIDTTKRVWIESVGFNEVLNEEITVREYDTEKEGSPLWKETTTKRQHRKDSEKSVKEKTDSGIIEEAHEKTDTAVKVGNERKEISEKEDTRMKWIGICFICVVLVFVLRLIYKIVK